MGTVVNGKSSMTVGDPGEAAGPPSLAVPSIRLTPELDAAVRAWMRQQHEPGPSYLGAVRHLVKVALRGGR